VKQNATISFLVKLSKTIHMNQQDQCMAIIVTRSTRTVHTSAKGLLVHTLLCSVTQRIRLMLLSVSPNSDESGRQSLYPDGDPDHYRNLISCSLAHCQPSLKLSCKSLQTFLRKVGKRQTDRQTNKQ